MDILIYIYELFSWYKKARGYIYRSKSHKCPSLFQEAFISCFVLEYNDISRLGISTHTQTPTQAFE
jgi:hypothetical protein